MKRSLVFIAFFVTLVLSGCAGNRLHREGMELLAQNHPEEGIAKLQAAAKEEPDNYEYKEDLINKKSEVVNGLLASASRARQDANLNEAEKMYKRALSFDPSNENAREGIESIAMDRRHEAAIKKARAAFEKGDSEKALAILKPVMIENPQNSGMLALKREIEAKESRDAFSPPELRTIYRKPVTLEFRDANLKMVFEALSRTTGINFILDKDIKPDLKATIFLQRASLDDAINLIMVSTQLQKQILNRNTVLIYPDTSEKNRQYRNLLVRSFYLNNADATKISEMLKNLLKLKDISVDEKLNVLTIRDTPEAIALAEKLIATHDLEESEVMLEVQVLEVQRSRLLDLGVQLPTQMTLTPLSANGTNLTLQDLKSINSSRIGVGISNTAINAQQEYGTVDLLANPRIRVRNREKAQIMIGDKVPVVTTTATATGFVSNNVQYIDVGLKLDVQPTIFLDGNVAIKMGLEVSSIVKETTLADGTTTYQLGTRDASTLLSLKDGETQILAGLINANEQATVDKFPGLGNLPVIGKLFSNTNSNNQKTEIVLSITPHLVRKLKEPGAGDIEFWSGTAERLQDKPLTIMPVNSGAAAPVTQSGQPNVSGEEGSNALPTVISLDWQGPSQAKVGEKFKIALNLKSDGGLMSLPYQLGFDPSSLQVIDVAEGDYFKKGGATTSFSYNVDPAGKILVGEARSSGKGAKGEGTLAVITFKALAGKPDTEIKVLAATPIGNGIKLPAPTLPEPHAIKIEKP